MGKVQQVVGGGRGGIGKDVRARSRQLYHIHFEHSTFLWLKLTRTCQISLLL